MFLACTLLNNILFYIALKLKTSALKGYITLAFCILVMDTRKEFQLQTIVFLKRPDVVTFDDCNFGHLIAFDKILPNQSNKTSASFKLRKS